MERLAHVTFGDCPPETRDKLAASQFISSLANEEMKRTLRLGGFKSLSATVLRAQEIEAVESDLRPSLQNEARSRPPLPYSRYPSRGMDNAAGSTTLDQEECTTDRSSKCWRCGRTSGEGLFRQEMEERRRKSGVVVEQPSIPSPSISRS